MAEQDDILIVGAGPVGLVAAIELARRGIQPRIIDKKAGPMPGSRALGVNARTLGLLAPCGATPLLLSRGNRLRHITLHDATRTLASIPLDDVDGPYPPIVVLPQDEVELLFAEVLDGYGVSVEWRTEMVELVSDGDSSLLTLERDRSETVSARMVIGADGAHSAVRRAVGLDFSGEAYDTEWGLTDVHISTELRLDGVNAFDLSPVLLAAIPIRGDLVRLVCNLPAVLEHVPPQIAVKEVIWQSRFRIAHRQVATYQKNGVFLAGDAAHVHSPLGARGMNLGIEDAAWLAWLIAEKRTADYTQSRLPVGREVVATADPATRLISSDSWFARFVRRRLLPVATTLPPVRHRALRQVSGLASPEPPWL